MSEAPRRSSRLNKNQEEKPKPKPVDNDVEMEETPEVAAQPEAPKEKVLGVKELEALAIAGSFYTRYSLSRTTEQNEGQ